MNNLPSTAFSCELLSALCDGELNSQELDDVLQAFETEPAVMVQWAGYQAIGNALRSQRDIAVVADTAFLGQFRQRLANDENAPAVSMVSALQPVDLPTGRVLPFKRPVQVETPRVVGSPKVAEATNDAVFRWKLVAGFASLAAVSAIAWNASGMLAPGNSPQLAQASPAVQQILVSSPQGTIVRDARLEELMAAHKQMGGTSALQGPAGFLRNATFEMPRNAGR